MSQMQADVESVLEKKGFAHQVIVQLSPAWTTDWMTEEAKSKLREYGIAPPGACTRASVMGLGRESVMRFIADASRVLPNVACPRCGSTDTVVTSEFGSTACKSLHRCQSCREPFDHFKAI
jgi:ring-1,2-phenylacetyl-CoA epoxidase subunit PaaD